VKVCSDAVERRLFAKRQRNFAPSYQITGTLPSLMAMEEIVLFIVGFFS